MANISITSVCNRSCPYCFAGDAFPGTVPGSAHMSRATFRQALDLLARSGQRQVRLLGGEPTLHPDFPAMVDEVRGRKMELLVFSNGLMPAAALQHLEALPAADVRVLINALDPSGSPRAEGARQAATLRRLGTRAQLGVNIWHPEVHLDFLLVLIADCKLSPSLRIGLAHPCRQASNAFLPPHHYQRVGRTIADFARTCGAAGVRIELDCGFVPCMFPEDARGWMHEVAAGYGQRCSPVVDILPDGTAISCYPLSSLAKVHIAEVERLDTLERYFHETRRPIRELGIYRECSACALKESGQCAGGCLSAAMLRLRHAAFAVSVPCPAGSASEAGNAERAECSPRRPDSPVRDMAGKTTRRWVIPYIDQPVAFWERVAEAFGEHIREVYFPLPDTILGSGRPSQPDRHLQAFLEQSPLHGAVLLNQHPLPGDPEDLAPPVLEALKKICDRGNVAAATVADQRLAELIRDALPGISLTASVLMDIAAPQQARRLGYLFQNLVPASRVMRTLPAVARLARSFPGRIRLIVNEACLPNCPFREQHFAQMACGDPFPRSLCEDLLQEQPWLRLTGAWVLPQHLELYDGVCSEFKLAGRVTLRDPDRYVRVLGAYIRRTPLSPDAIGGGPAAPQQPMHISEPFYRHTLSCGFTCQNCQVCRDYYDMHQGL